MHPYRLAAIALIALGAAALAYGGFSYTRDSSRTAIGPIALTVTDRRRVKVPVWVGVFAIAIGAGLALAPTGRVKI